MRKFKATLNTDSLDKLIKDLTDYRDSLDDKTRRFVDLLLDKGIKRAETMPGISGSFGTHKFERFVWYSKELNPKTDGCYGVMLGQGRTFDVTWGENGEKSGSINAMLALEFGTAGRALSAQAAFGGFGGKGTNSYYGHADDDEWFFADGKDSDGRLIWKRATAITPTRPMYNAAKEMKKQIVATAREVFRE